LNAGFEGHFWGQRFEKYFLKYSGIGFTQLEQRTERPEVLTASSSVSTFWESFTDDRERLVDILIQHRWGFRMGGGVGGLTISEPGEQSRWNPPRPGARLVFAGLNRHNGRILFTTFFPLDDTNTEKT
jgi:hypothetical protein